TGTIQNDDTAPVLTVANLTQVEGDKGTTAFNFIVTLTGSTGLTTTVNYATANGTATTADGDYSATTGTVTFAPGVTTQTVTVLVNGDTKFEANDTFSVALSAPSNATVSASQGTATGTIVNDDTAPVLSVG